MPRTITDAMDAELGADRTTPAYFVEIQFSTNLRLSSRGTRPWNGNQWDSRKLGVQLSFDNTPKQSGTLTVGDSDLAMTAIILREGVANRPINIWKYYGTAPAPDDPAPIFSGVGDAVTFNSKAGTVSIALVKRSATGAFCPRRYQTRAIGYSILPVSGKIITFNGENYKLISSRGGR